LKRERERERENNLNFELKGRIEKKGIKLRNELKKIKRMRKN